jgi:hypothetical protein
MDRRVPEQVVAATAAATAASAMLPSTAASTETCPSPSWYVLNTHFRVNTEIFVMTFTKFLSVFCNPQVFGYSLFRFTCSSLKLYRFE